MNAPVPVLYVANAAKIGGGNRSMIDLITGLDQDRYEPHLVAPAGGPIVDWARTTGIPHVIVPDGDLAGRMRVAQRGARLLPYIISRRTQVVHAMAPTCYRAAALAGLLTGAVRVCHLGFPPEPGELAWCFWSGPEAVIGCYQQQATDVSAEIARINPRCRVIGIPNGVDLARFAPRPSDAAAIRAELGIGERPLVLIVGHLSEVKGYPTFLHAARLIAEAMPDCAFAALGGETIGDGYRATLEELAVSLGIRDRLHFLGFKNDVASVLQAADVVTLPSRSEGLPLALLEAMACARAVVATPVGGVPEAVVAGQTGLLVPPDNPGHLAAAIMELLRDPTERGRLGVRARAHVEARFSIRGFVKGVERLYDDLLTARDVGASAAMRA